MGFLDAMVRNDNIVVGLLPSPAYLDFLFLFQINELSNVPVPVMLMPDDFKAYSKIKVDNHLFNKWVMNVTSAWKSASLLHWLVLQYVHRCFLLPCSDRKHNSTEVYVIWSWNIWAESVCQLMTFHMFTCALWALPIYRERLT